MAASSVTWTPDPDIGHWMQRATVKGLRVSVMRAVFGDAWFWGTEGCMGQNKVKRSEAAAKRAAIKLVHEIHAEFASVVEKFGGLIEAVDVTDIEALDATEEFSGSRCGGCDIRGPNDDGVICPACGVPGCPPGAHTQYPEDLRS
jgi:hypothetical protein